MKIEVLIKVLVLMTGLYIVAKVFAPFIADFFGSSKKKSDHDIDEMIRRKTDLLKMTGASSASEIINSSKNLSQSNANKKEKVEFDQLVKQCFQALSAQNNKTDVQIHKQAELKRIMNLLDALQWGQTDEMPNIRRRFEKHFDFAPDEALFLRALRLCLIHAPLVDERKDPKPFDDIIDFIVAVAAHDIFRSTFISSEPSHAQTLAKRWHTDIITLQRTWLLWTSQKTKLGTQDLVSQLVLHDGIFTANDLMSLLGVGPDGLPWTQLITETDRPRRGNELVESLREELAMMRAIVVLPDEQNINREQALYLMSFESVPAPGILSRRYKKMARLMHPDRLSSRGFPPVVMDRVNANFRTLKAAYDLLKAEAE